MLHLPDILLTMRIYLDFETKISIKEKLFLSTLLDDPGSVSLSSIQVIVTREHAYLFTYLSNITTTTLEQQLLLINMEISMFFIPN